MRFALKPISFVAVFFRHLLYFSDVVAEISKSQAHADSRTHSQIIKLSIEITKDVCMRSIVFRLIQFYWICGCEHVIYIHIEKKGKSNLIRNTLRWENDLEKKVTKTHTVLLMTCEIHIQITWYELGLESILLLWILFFSACEGVRSPACGIFQKVSAPSRINGCCKLVPISLEGISCNNYFGR